MSERDELQAQTAEETLRAAEHAAGVRRHYVEDLVGHAVALLLTSGFFLLAFAVLLGFVDIKESAVATMVGTIVGLAAAKIDPILLRYFKALPPPPAPKPAAAPPAAKAAA